MESKTYTILIDPIGKPRMTRQDAWAKRPRVMRYFTFKDLLVKLTKQQGLVLGNTIKVRLTIAMPKSWSKKKKDAMRGRYHQQRPDIDNILKAIMDSLLPEDSHIHTIVATKIWGDIGQIEFIKGGESPFLD